MPTSPVMPRPLRAVGLVLLAALVAVALLLLGTPAHATPSEADLTKQIDAKSKQFDKAVQEYDKVQDQLTASKKKEKAVNKKLKPLQAKVDKAQQAVGKMAAAAYRGGKPGAVNAILSDGSASTLLDSLSLLDQLARNQSKQIADLNKAKAALDKKKSELDTAIGKQTQAKKKLASQKSSLDKDVQKLRDLRTQAYGSPTNYDTNVDYGPAPNLPGSAGKAVDYAWAQLGKPYNMGSAGPNAFDCSGLTMMAWNAAGYSLAHSSYTQYSQTHRISRNQLEPGDLVFYSGNEHVAIYIGGNQIIHAPTYGEPVQKASVDMMTPDGYGRVG